MAVFSQQSNVQGFKRLRKLASGKVPEFVYFSCADIEKHMTHHERKVDLLRGRTLYFQTENVYTPVCPLPC